MSQDPWVQELGIQRPDLLLDSFAAAEAESGERGGEREILAHRQRPREGKGKTVTSSGSWKAS